jgi:hypothetical protein
MDKEKKPKYASLKPRRKARRLLRELVMTQSEATKAPDPYGPSVDSFLEAHLKAIEKKIRARAAQFAKDDGSGEQIQPMHVAAAARLYAPGYPLFEWAKVGQGASQGEEQPSNGPGTTSQVTLGFRDRILSSISGVTIISAILAIVFGAIGAYGLSQGTQNVQGFIDIAQIFAGAIVGSAGAAVVSPAGASTSTQ